MIGWVPLDASTWPTIAEVLPRPWLDEWAWFDLRWYADPLATGGVERPGGRQLAERWGWSRKRVRNLVADPSRWADANRVETGAHPGPTRGPPGAHLDDSERQESDAKGPPGAHPGPTRGPHDLWTLRENARASQITDTDTGLATERSEPGRPLGPSPSPPVDLPAWLGPWARKHRRLDRAGLVDGLARVLEVVQGRASTPTKTTAPPVLRLWSAMLEESLGDIPPAALLPELVRVSVLLAEAARDCPAPVFARDLRAEGWEGGTDRSRKVAAVCRLTPPGGSSGATWLERVEVAEAWHAAGRPLTGWPTSGAPTAPARRSAPLTIAERLARAREPRQQIRGGVE